MPASALLRESAPTADVPVLLRAGNIFKTFGHGSLLRSRRAATAALHDVSFDIAQGEILGIVGESGSGKSTLGRILVGLIDADTGCLELEGRVLFGPGHRTIPATARGIQIIFQDPYSSLNPRMTVGSIVAEGLRIRGDLPRKDISDRIARTLALVGFAPDALDRYPHQFSGGQRQRISIARALVLEPKLLVADEAVSALDVSVQMQILNVLLDLQMRLGLSIIFITHNIAVVEYLCERVLVMSRGEIVERGRTTDVVDSPSHAYTRNLIAAAPKL
jgi:ABC-type glutathione transport system ATPase component